MAAMNSAGFTISDNECISNQSNIYCSSNSYYISVGVTKIGRVMVVGSAHFSSGCYVSNTNVTSC